MLICASLKSCPLKVEQRIQNPIRLHFLTMTTAARAMHGDVKLVFHSVWMP